MSKELPLDHEPSFDHWAKCIADEDIATGECTNWDYAYEQAWHSLEAEHNIVYTVQHITTMNINGGKHD